MNNKININLKQNATLTEKNNPVIIEIEYEKIGNNKAVNFDENGNFNVYFMEPVLRSKTITTSNMNHKKNQSKNNMINDDNDDNPYKYDDDNMNVYPQFQNKNSDVMPLEIVHKKNEKKFKAHLIQRLKSFKMKQVEKNKIPLNIASKKRREETFRESLKHLLARQAEPFDIKKELMYYKGYFRFWKRKCKNFGEPKIRKIIKKDRNIRITTVIYKADNPSKINNKKQKIVQDSKIQKENEIFRKNLIINLENRKKEKREITYNLNNNYNINYYPKNVNASNNKVEKNSQIIDKKLHKSIKNKDNSNNNNINGSVNVNNNKNTNEGLEKVNNINNKKEEKKITDKLKITQNIDRKKEALKKINNLLEKEIEGEGFKQLKYVRNKSRKKEGTQKIEKVLERNCSKSKGDIMHKLKKNQSKSKITQASRIVNNIINIKKNNQVIEGYKQLKEYSNKKSSKNKKENIINDNNVNNVNNVNDVNNVNNVNNEIKTDRSQKIDVENENINTNVDINISNNNVKENENDINNISGNGKEKVIMDVNIKKDKEQEIVIGENEKWTINKFNWQLDEVNKENDSLFGISEDEFKNSINKNSINANSQNNSQKNYQSQINNSEEQLIDGKNPKLDIKITEHKNNKKERKIGNLFTNDIYNLSDKRPNSSIFRGKNNK